MMVKRQSIALLSCLALGACGDDGGGDGTAVPDAGPVVVADAAPEPNFCTVIEASYPDLGSVTGTATLAPTDEDMPDGPQIISLQIPLNEESPPDVLFIELWEDLPPFSDGPPPYTINLIGDQADLVLCGACTYIASDFSDPNMVDHNIAYSGQLVISAMDSTPGTGTVVGSLSNVKLHEVDFDMFGQHIVDEGCRSTLEKVAFTFDIEAADPP